jgi:hypothetical protein
VCLQGAPDLFPTSSPVDITDTAANRARTRHNRKRLIRRNVVLSNGGASRGARAACIRMLQEAPYSFSGAQVHAEHDPEDVAGTRMCGADQSALAVRAGVAMQRGPCTASRPPLKGSLEEPIPGVDPSGLEAAVVREGRARDEVERQVEQRGGELVGRAAGSDARTGDAVRDREQTRRGDAASHAPAAEDTDRRARELVFRSLRGGESCPVAASHVGSPAQARSSPRENVHCDDLLASLPRSDFFHGGQDGVARAVVPHAATNASPRNPRNSDMRGAAEERQRTSMKAAVEARHRKPSVGRFDGALAASAMSPEREGTSHEPHSGALLHDSRHGARSARPSFDSSLFQRFQYVEGPLHRLRP